MNANYVNDVSIIHLITIIQFMIMNELDVVVLPLHSHYFSFSPSSSSSSSIITIII